MLKNSKTASLLNHIYAKEIALREKISKGFIYIDLEERVRNKLASSLMTLSPSQTAL